MNVRRPAGAALLAAGLLAALAGCGGAATAPSAAAPATAAPAAATTSPTEQVCTNLLKIDGIASPDSGPDSQPAPDAVKAWATQVSPLLADASAIAPSEVAPALTALKPYLTAATEQGTNPDSEDPALGMALAGYETWAHENCGYQKVDLTGVDFMFTGAPTTLTAGATSILLKNESTSGQFHVALMARPIDQTLTLEKLLALPMDQLMTAVEPVPGGAAAPPGQSGGFMLDLKAGKYFLLCPVGDEGQAPHFMQGMINEVTVT